MRLSRTWDLSLTAGPETTSASSEASSARPPRHMWTGPHGGAVVDRNRAAGDLGVERRCCDDLPQMRAGFHSVVEDKKFLFATEVMSRSKNSDPGRKSRSDRSETGGFTVKVFNSVARINVQNHVEDKNPTFLSQFLLFRLNFSLPLLCLGLHTETTESG